MSHNSLANTNINFHQSLLDLDIKTAQAVKKEGCRHCKGTLHQSNYPRIVFGLNPQLAPLYDKRFSFCCADCRCRTTPPSVRFLGRRRFASSVFILLCASRHFCPNLRSCARLAQRFGIHLSPTIWHPFVANDLKALAQMVAGKLPGHKTMGCGQSPFFICGGCISNPQRIITVIHPFAIIESIDGIFGVFIATDNARSLREENYTQNMSM